MFNFDDLYYYGLHFIDQNGLLLIIGAIICSLGVYIFRKEPQSKVAVGLMLIRGIILLFSGILKLLYFLFIISLGIGLGFGLYYATKND